MNFSVMYQLPNVVLRDRGPAGSQKIKKFFGVLRREFLTDYQLGRIVLVSDETSGSVTGEKSHSFSANFIILESKQTQLRRKIQRKPKRHTISASSLPRLPSRILSRSHSMHCRTLSPSKVDPDGSNSGGS